MEEKSDEEEEAVEEEEWTEVSQQILTLSRLTCQRIHSKEEERGGGRRWLRWRRREGRCNGRSYKVRHCIAVM